MVDEDLSKNEETPDVVNIYDFKKGVLSHEAELHWKKVFCTTIPAVDLLKLKLKEFEHDLDKSSKAYLNGEIDVTIHLKHRVNLTKLINNYSTAINILEINTNE